SASGGSGGGRGIDGLSLKLDDSMLGKGMESSITRNKSASSKRGSFVELSEISFFTRLINLS
nr:hypothetical protein [Tanacetum cinerariifolium]